jgi:chitinase
LSNPDNTLIFAGQGQATATITDDDAPPSVSIGDASNVAETGGANQTFTVSLSAASAKPITVHATTVPGTATAGSDFTTTTGTITFAPGTTSQPFTVPVLDDTVDENNESYTAEISLPTNATINDGSGAGTITDDDTWPTLSVAANAVTTAESGSAGFTVTLSAVSAQTVTVNWQTVDGTAGSADYTQQLSPAPLTFAPGVTSQPISVPVTADVIDEANETFSVTLSGPTNAFLATATATATILDNDATPTLSVSDPANVTEIPGGVSQTFTVALSAVSGLPVSVVASTNPGTASAGSDYTHQATLLSLPAGTLAQNFVVAVLDDDQDEPNQSYDVVLSSATNAGIGDGTGTGTIVDDDVYPNITVSPAAPAVAESGTANFTVDLSAPSNLTVAVTWQTATGTAGAADFTTQAPAVLTFTPGQTSLPIAVPITTDALDEDNETFSINLSSPSHGVVTGGSTVTITDDDASPVLNIADAPIRNERNTGVLTQAFTATLSAPSGRTVTVVASTQANTATADVDYQSGAQTLTFVPGDTSETFTAIVLDDLIDEDNTEVYFVNLYSPVNATVGDGNALGTIGDNEAAPTVSLNDVAVTEGNSGTVAATFTATLSAVSGRQVRVALATANNSASAPSDYTARTGTGGAGINVYIAPGATTATFSVQVKGETAVELNETFFVNVVSLANATIADGQGVGTINNDD